MQEVQTHFRPTKILVKPETKIIRCVEWELLFVVGQYQGLSVGETFLPDPEDPSNVIQAEDVTNDTLMDWVFKAEGQGALLDELTEFHTQRAAELAERETLEVFHEEEPSP